jgi:dTDP-4-amino-4,6-dideoxygalactose transaminase
MTTDDDEIVLVKPLIPPRDRIQAAVREVLDSGVLTNDGPQVRRLEQELSRRIGVDDLAVCGSGTAAIQLACAALGMRGREVLVPAAAFPAVVQAVLRAGGTPVAVDIESAYLTLDPEAVAAALSPATGAILGVHTFGCPAAVDALGSVARAAGVPLLFDGAPCWGIHYRGIPLLAYGDAATLSLHATKLMHSVEGGAVIGNTVPLAATVRRLRNFGGGASSASPDGTNARMSEFHAALGRLLLEETDAEVIRRQAVRKQYSDALRDIGWLRQCPYRPDAGPNVAAMPVRLAGDAWCDAETLARRMQALGVHARAYFAGRYRVDPVRTGGPTPHAAAAARRVLCLPFHGGLTESHIGRVVGALRHAYRDGSAQRV